MPNTPASPKQAWETSHWFVTGANLITYIAFATQLFSQLYAWMSGRSLDAFHTLLLNLLAVVFLLYVRLITGRSRARKDFINNKLPNYIRAKSHRDEVESWIVTREKWSTVFISIGYGIILFLSCSYTWGEINRFVSTKVPDAVRLVGPDRFTPSTQKYLLEEAPFLSAVLGDLEGESSVGGKKYQSGFLSSEAFPHPTPPFLLTIFYDENAYDISGYAFIRRKRDAKNQFEAVPMEFPKDGTLKLRIPSCEKGDRILIAVRLSLNQASDFPLNLTEKTRTKTQKMED